MSNIPATFTDRMASGQSAPCLNVDRIYPHLASKITMGPAVCSAAPTVNTDVANKKYVDDTVAHPFTSNAGTWGTCFATPIAGDLRTEKSGSLLFVTSNADISGTTDVADSNMVYSIAFADHPAIVQYIPISGSIGGTAVELSATLGTDGVLSIVRGTGTSFANASVVVIKPFTVAFSLATF